jgi:hypothetical protein
VTINEALAPAGSMVEELNDRGDVLGSFEVVRTGRYGFMRVYGEDPAADPAIPGMAAGEGILFRVNGFVANPVSSPVAWESGPDPIQVDLAAVPALPVPDLLASIAGAYDYVLGEGGTFSPTPPYPNANSLHHMEPGRGYFVRATVDTTLALEGQWLAVDSPMPLGSGWHWIGYLPPQAQVLPDALQSVSGAYDYVVGEDGTYAPLMPAHLNTLREMRPGQGYLIRMRQPGNLVYLPTSASSNQIPTDQTRSQWIVNRLSNYDLGAFQR